MRKKTLCLVVRLASVCVLACFVPAGVACRAPQRGHDPALVGRLDEILHREDECGATFAARVLEMPSRRELYAVNIDVPRIPASNMKLPVSATGLDAFGPNHTFKTYLAFDGEDLWIIGTGDPALGDAKIARRSGGDTMTVLQQWTEALTRRGVRHIPGDIRTYAGALDNHPTHASWDADDLVHWYAAPVSGLNFNDNCVDVTVFPTQDGQPAGYEVTPPTEGIVVVNECVSGNDAPPSITRMPYANVIVLGGGCTKRKSLKSKPVTDPEGFLADALRTHLRSNGIRVDGSIRSAPVPLGGRLPPTAHVVATHETKITDLMWRINKNSQNLFAECMCKLAGRAYHAKRGRTVPGSWASGDRAIRAFCHRNAIDDRQFVLADGSGLSDDNRVTARLMTDLLAVMFEHETSDPFRESLSVAGQDGTLARRMMDIKGHVFAKTGYIRGVRALSGYVKTRGDTWLCFSILYNDIPGSVKPFEALQDEACQALVDWPDLQGDSDAEADPSAVLATGS